MIPYRTVPYRTMYEKIYGTHITREREYGTVPYRTCTVWNGIYLKKKKKKKKD